jgi:hypothetical protein
MMPHTTTPLADSIGQLQQQLEEVRAAHPARTNLPQFIIAETVFVGGSILVYLDLFLAEARQAARNSSRRDN